MKLYDGGRAPNPRRTRIFLAEKGIKVPIEPVDLGAMQQRSEIFAAINPVMRVPALVLDDGTGYGVDRDLLLLKRPADPPLFQWRAETAPARCEPAAELHFSGVPIPQFHPAMGDGSAAGAGLAEPPPRIRFITRSTAS